MKRESMIGIAALALAASVYGFLDTHKALSRTESELKRYPNYVRALELKDAASILKNAELKLYFRPSRTTTINGMPYMCEGVPITHSAEYPDAKDARAMIDSTLTELGDCGEVDGRLRDIRSSLPDQSDIREYRGKDVDNSTFEQERNAINGAIGEIHIAEDFYMDKVPAHLKSEKNKILAKYVAYFLAGLGSIFLGFYGLSERKVY